MQTHKSRLRLCMPPWNLEPVAGAYPCGIVDLDVGRHCRGCDVVGDVVLDKGGELELRRPVC